MAAASELSNIPPSTEESSITTADAAKESETSNAVTSEVEKDQKDLDPELDLTDEHTAAPPKDWRFWSVIFCLGICSILAAIDATIVVTALPSITATLSGAQNYVWVIGAYFATRFVFLQ
jgi:hypothetical protein